MATPRRSTLRGRRIAAVRKAREYAMVVRALASTSHPVLAQIIPSRFCNLSCGYCNEYDKVSEPVPSTKCSAASTTSAASAPP
jgi:sulfatase maturation enzyme AslB (radical SAM superfamily)